MEEGGGGVEAWKVVDILKEFSLSSIKVAGASDQQSVQIQLLYARSLVRTVF